MGIKISKKITISIASVVLVVSIISILINLFFVGRYYIYEKRKILNNIEKLLLEKDTNDFINNIKQIEEENDVVIVYSELSRDINSINEELISGFSNKKVKLNKFWVTEEILKNAENESVNKIYDQGTPKYRMLTKFINKDGYIFSIGLSLPYISETIGIVNRFNIFLNIFSIISIIVLCGVISKKIIKPLDNIKVLSKDISNLNFRKEEIQTNDEIGELAVSINLMSERLEKAHNEINSQNQNLKSLISDISHELKTPLALVKVYGQGIKDGLDDGTYMDIIQEQIDHMDNLIERLLYWSRIDREELELSNFSLNKKIVSIIKKYKVLIEEYNIKLILDMKVLEEYTIYADEEAINIVFNNLITNAIKYTNNKKIEIAISEENNRIKFTIKNGLDKYVVKDLEKIWTPFYVLEKSRSKELSGTGLGLPIVKKILEKHNFKFSFNVEDEWIEFHILF